jgi:hypothetical protein
LVLGLSVLAATPTRALEVLDRYEQAWLTEAKQTSRPSVDGAADEARAAFVAQVLSDENRLTVEAKVSWVRDLRREVERLVGSHGHTPE